jgi:cob(I)alamin adenosyltransferase
MASSSNKRIYTKYGDDGQTGLLYGGRVSKNGPHTESYGVCDEALSAMGLARALSEDDRVKSILKELQEELFTVAAESQKTVPIPNHTGSAMRLYPPWVWPGHCQKTIELSLF